MSDFCSFKDLDVWKKGMELVKAVYEIAAILPEEEKFALSDQLRRASVSVPSNIAEGYKRNSPKEFVTFLSNAIGSAAEVETQILIAEDLKMITEEQSRKAVSLCEETGKMINSFLGYIKRKNNLQ